MYIANIYSGNWPEVPVRHENTLMSRNSLLIRENMTPCQRQRQTETRRKQNESGRTGWMFFCVYIDCLCHDSSWVLCHRGRRFIRICSHTTLVQSVLILSWHLLINVDKSDTYTRLKSWISRQNIILSQLNITSFMTTVWIWRKVAWLVV